MGEVFGTRFTITDETLRIKRALGKAEVIANDDMETVEAAARAPDAEEAGFCVIAVTRRGERWVVSEMPTAAAAQSLAKAIRGRWKISQSPLALQPFNPRLEADRERYRSAWRSWRRARRGIAMAPLVLVGSALTAMPITSLLGLPQYLIMLAIIPSCTKAVASSLTMQLMHCPSCGATFRHRIAGLFTSVCSHCRIPLGALPGPAPRRALAPEADDRDASS
jgi:hypothetical protein